jgi:hypothetical protein
VQLKTTIDEWRIQTDRKIIFEPWELALITFASGLWGDTDHPVLARLHRVRHMNKGFQPVVAKEKALIMKLTI